MARTQPGENKTPLVITLAFFVLATLVLGVLTYLAYSDLEKARADVKKANDEKTNAAKLMNAEEEKKLLYKGLLGTLSADESAKLQNLREKDAVREEYNQLRDGIERRVQAVVRSKAQDILAKDPNAPAFNLPSKEVLDWDWTADGTLPVQPKTPLADQVVAFFAAQQLSNIEVQQRIAKMDEAMKAADARAKNADDQAARYKQELDALPGKIAAIQKKFDTDAANIRGGYEAEVKKFNDERQLWDKEKNELQLEVRQRREDHERQVRRADAYASQLESKEDPFSFDQPHGKIERVRSDRLVEINLGSSDNVKAGLKFSVQPSDTPKKGFDSRRARDGTIIAKGKIEVVQVLGPHQSVARITQETDPIRDSVIAGDLLYNSVWRKGQPDHVALFGVFDLNGDGTDDIKQLTKDLNRMGIVVDAYFDLDQKKWVGRLTEKTIYAVQGNVPFKDVHPGEPVDVIAAKGTILKALEDAQKDVKDRGTKVVRMRDFFPRIGYPVNMDVDEKRIDQAAARYLRGGTGSAEEPAAEPKQ